MTLRVCASVTACNWLAYASIWRSPAGQLDLAHCDRPVRSRLEVERILAEQVGAGGVEHSAVTPSSFSARASQREIERLARVLRLA